MSDITDQFKAIRQEVPDKTRITLDTLGEWEKFIINNKWKFMRRFASTKFDLVDVVFRSKGIRLLLNYPYNFMGMRDYLGQELIKYDDFFEWMEMINAEAAE